MLGGGSNGRPSPAAAASEASTRPNSALGPKMLQDTHTRGTQTQAGLSPSRQGAGALG